MGQEEDKNEEKSCCTWPKVVVLITVAAIGAILIWRLAPIDRAIDSVLPTFNNTANDDSAGDEQGSPTESPTTKTPDDGSDEYPFMQCADPTSTDCCNGLDTICDLGVDDILYATMHNAAATFEDGVLFGSNHRYAFPRALEEGFRGLNIDFCNCDGDLVSCHGYCSQADRFAEDIFKDVNDFLEANPSDLIAIQLQLNENAGLPIDVDELYAKMNATAGFTDKFYIHPNITDDWPTLGELIHQEKKQVLMFHYAGPTCTGDDKPDACDLGMHYYWDYAVNTPFNFADLSEIRATSHSCSFNGRVPGVAGKTFFGVNNFVTPPVQSSAQTLNSKTFAENRIATCSQDNDFLDVNFVYVDFWREGDMVELTQEHNAKLGLGRRRRQNENGQQEQEQQNLRH